MIKGNQAFKEKQWKKAIIYYNEAIKLNDKNATYYSNRAAAHLELGRYCFILECCCIGILLYLVDKFLIFQFPSSWSRLFRGYQPWSKGNFLLFWLALLQIACFHYFSSTMMKFSLKPANLIRFAEYRCNISCFWRFIGLSCSCIQAAITLVPIFYFIFRM